jgi:hypothetical protein
MHTQESVRRALLVQLEAAYPITLPIETLWQGLRIAGLPSHNETVRKELEYLLDKGFIQCLSNELCPHHRRYKLASKGIDFLETNS